MTRETRSGYVLDRLTWAMAGIGLSEYAAFDTTGRVIWWLLIAFLVGSAVLDLMNRRRFPRPPA